MHNISTEVISSLYIGTYNGDTDLLLIPKVGAILC